MPVTLELSLRDLRSFHETLLRALSEAGHGGAEWAEIFSQRVSAECVQCGIQLTGDELVRTLATTEPEGTGAEKQARLLQGYCARNGCPSYFYRLTFRPLPDGLAWQPLLEKARQLAEARAEEAAATAVNQDRTARRRRHRQLARVALAALGLVALWALQHRWRTGSFPGEVRKSKYEVDPASLRPENPRATPPP